MFISKNSSKTKFDLLLLGEEEYYFSDESVAFIPATKSREETQSLKGRMKICSQSLFFDPQDECLPIVRYAFQDISLIDTLNNFSAFGEVSSIFIIKTKKITQMRANNVIEPYEFLEGDITHKFILNYVPLPDFISRIEKLLKISKLPRWSANDHVKELIEEKEAQTTFDTSWLQYLDERPLKEQNCVRVTPLVHNPGRLMITNKIVYFHPMNNIDANPVEKFPFSKIIRVIKRRHALTHVGLEIFLEDDNNTLQSVFFAFRTESIRNSVFKQLTGQPGMTKLQHENQSNTTFRWQCGLISNFDYLMYLNSLADRTFNDLTQYPVFPWIIIDYKSDTLDLENPATFRDLSKPIGALNPTRLHYFKKRYNDMDTPKFLYGTHYSTPGYVLYYLVRVAPEYMLRLQNGKFDAPDRLFTGIGSTWDSIYNNTGDLKELIPEFFVQPGTFLLNTDDLRLGRKQDGTWVGDVGLPPWASCPSEFIQKHRDALECDYVSDHLHLWIDLIFGYKQQGDAAFDSDNVFHPSTYEGAINLEEISDPIQREAAIVQINEFGQTPKQIFVKPHPKRFAPDERERKKEAFVAGNTSMRPTRLGTDYEDDHDIVAPTKESLMLDLGKDKPLPFPLAFHPTASSGWQRLAQLRVANTLKFHRGKVSAVQLSQDSKTIFSVSHDCYLKVYDLERSRQLRSIKISQLSLSSIGLGNDDKLVYTGSWDNNVYIYSVDYSRVVDTLYAHDDAISDMCIHNDYLITGSWDCTVRVWKARPSGIDKAPCADFVDHESEVKCVDLNKDRNIVVSGAVDGKIYYSDIRTGTAIRLLHAHANEVTRVKFTDDGRLISTGMDNCLKVFDVVGQEIFQIDLGEALRCVATNGEQLLLGGDDGVLRAWNLISTEEIEKHFSENRQPITCISASANGDTVAVGDESGAVTHWTLPEENDD